MCFYFADFEKAFDSVVRDAFLLKGFKANISCIMIQLIRSQLCATIKSCVKMSSCKDILKKPLICILD